MAETQAPPAAGTFCWNELMTRDADAAKKFYFALFDWQAQDMDMGEMGVYTIFKKGEKEIGGMMEMAGEQFEGVPPHWMGYIAVDDVDVSTNKAEQLGAQICVPPTDIPGVGRFSVITDPTGATISLFKSRS